MEIRVASLRTKLRRIGRALAAHNRGGLVLSNPVDAGEAQAPPAVDEQLERLEAYRDDLIEQFTYWVGIRSERRGAAQVRRRAGVAGRQAIGPMSRGGVVRPELAS